MKETDSHYEIIVNRDAKREELIFWAKLAIKKLERINEIFDEVIKKCEEQKEREETEKMKNET